MAKKSCDGAKKIKWLRSGAFASRRYDALRWWIQNEEFRRMQCMRRVNARLKDGSGRKRVTGD